MSRNGNPDRERADALTRALEQAGNSCAPDGWRVDKVRGSYSPGVVRVTIEYHADGDDAPEVVAWRERARYLDLPADGIGRTIRYGPHEYRIVGLLPRSKYPVLAERLDNGKRFKLATAGVRLALARADCTASPVVNAAIEYEPPTDG